jgi:hypothetical protein
MTHTEQVILEIEVKLALLRLFDKMDVARIDALSVPEFIFGLRLSGICCDAPNLSGFFLQSKSGGISCELFFKIMMSAEILGKQTPEEQLESVSKLVSAWCSDGSQLQILKFKKAFTWEPFLHKSEHSEDEYAEAEATSDLKLDDATLELTFDFINDSVKTRLQGQNPGTWMRLFCLILLWWFCAATVYTFVNDWAFPQSMYYGIQAGLSIGFGVLNEGKVQRTS